MRIDIVDRVIETVRVDYAVTLGLSAGAEVRIEAPFEISGPGCLPVIVDVDGVDGDRRCPRELQGRTIIRAEAEDAGGALVIALDNRTELRVPVDADYEAWIVTGVNGAVAVALPGGGVARWDWNGQDEGES